MFPGFHGFDLIILLVIALLFFGPKKLPEVGSAIGKSIQEYRKSMKEVNLPDREVQTALTATGVVLQVEAGKSAEEGERKDGSIPL